MLLSWWWCDGDGDVILGGGGDPDVRACSQPHPRPLKAPQTRSQLDLQGLGVKPQGGVDLVAQILAEWWHDFCKPPVAWLKAFSEM